jgi:hypothetical protein
MRTITEILFDPGIDTYTKCGPFSPQKGLAIMVGVICLGGLIFFAKGIYRESYFMAISGWLIAAIATVIGTAWIALGHCPICAENADVSSVSGASATCYRRVENGRVLPIVIPELKLCDVQRQIFAAD